jgi:hypothetical protein
VLSSIENSMNGSFMNHKQSQKRTSLSKMPLQECDDRNIENYHYYRKMSEYPRASNKPSEQKASTKI